MADRDFDKSYPLWDASKPFPLVAQIPQLDEIEHIRVHTAAEEFTFLLGAAIAEHKGILYTGWGNSVVDENDTGSIMAGRRSSDGGRTWSGFEIIAPNPHGPDAHSHGVFLSYGDALWAFAPRAEYGDVKGFPNLRMEAFILNEQTGQWESRGIVAGNQFWPMQEPLRMANGDFVMAGCITGRWPNAYAAVAISHADDLLGWDIVRIPSPEGLKYWGETTVLVDGNEITAIIRYGGGESLALVSVSEDYGRTWSEIGKSNFPMVPSKPYAGALSTGQRYLISNTPSKGHRSTLTVVVTRPGERTFSRIWKIRHGPSPEPRFKGLGHTQQWAYPYAIEYDGNLYVVYASTKENCELSIIPVRSLKAG